jgi:nucleoside-diphosphate-sugar epimerase
MRTASAPTCATASSKGEMKMKPVVITGANGFIGSNLAAFLKSQGFHVRGLVRSPSSTTLPGIELFKGELPNGVDAAAFESAGTVIHCAYATKFRSAEQARLANEEGTKRVIRLSREAGVERIVFLSSLSAHEGAQSYYGQSKFAMEKLFDSQRDIILRAGLVVGSGDAGLFRRMIDPILKYPIVPLLDGGGQVVQIIHIDDLCSAIHSVLAKNLTGLLAVADPKGISMKEFLRLVAAIFRKHTTFIPLPSTPVLYGVKLMESLHIPFPISSENILGLQNLRFVDTSADLAKLGIQLMAPEESLRRIASSFN